MTKKEIELLSNKIESDGFDYTMVHGLSPDKVTNINAKAYWEKFLQARKNLVEFLKRSGVDIEE